MQDSRNIKETLDRLLSENDRVYIIPHSRPDMAALGSSIAMSLLCQKPNYMLGKYIMIN